MKNRPINWEEQWAFHSPHFHQGKVVVDLSLYGGKGSFEMKAGPGFGDLSHPTTRLVMRQLSKHVKGRTVIDIGSGSGVLSLAAACEGASQVIGIDIDPEAVLHAEENAHLNRFEKVTFCTPDQFIPPRERSGVILMNMIMSEQETAWKSLPLAHFQGVALTSGVLAEQKEEYLAISSGRGWVLKACNEEEGWLAFCFELTP